MIFNSTASRSATDTADRPVSRRLGSQTLYLALGNVFTLAVGLPLQVYVARVIGTEGLGIYGLIEGGVGAASGMLNFGVGQTVLRFVPEHLERGEYGYVRTLARLGLLIVLGIGAAGYAFVLVSLNWIGSLWPGLAEHSTEIAVMGLLFPLGMLLAYLQQGLRGFHEIRYVVMGSSFMQLTTKAILTITMFALGLRLLGYIVATVVAVAFAVLWMGLGLRHRLRQMPHDSAQTVSQAWAHYAVVSSASTLIGAVTSSLDRFLIGAFMGAGAVGVLVVIRQLQQMPAVFNQMLLMVGAPMFATAHSRGDRAEVQHLFAVMTDWVVRASLPLLIFLFLFARPILTLFGVDFAADGTLALHILVVAQLVNVLTGPNGTVAQMCGLERPTFRATMTTNVAASLALIALIPLFGLAGAAIALAINIAATNVWLLILIRRRLHIVWWDPRYIGWAIPSALTLAAAVGLRFFNVHPGALELAAALCGMYAIFFGATLMQGLHDDDRDLLQYLLARLLGRPMPKSV